MPRKRPLPGGRLRPSSVLALVALLGAALAVTAASAASAGAQPTATAGEERQTVPGEWVVGFDDGLGPREERRLVVRAGGRVDERIASIDGVVVEGEDRPAATVAQALAREQGVRFVEPNYVVRAARLPNDPGFVELWGLRNTGQLGGTPGADIAAPAAWEISTGGPVTVAVIDTGVHVGHPDLAPNLWVNPDEQRNGQDDDGNGFVDDVHGVDLVGGDPNPHDTAGHGTHLAGIIGAVGDNGTGVVGVNWSPRLMAIRFLSSSGQGTTADAARAIDYATSEGARVINASWGGPMFSQTLHSAVRRAVDRGVLFVAAAGNDGRNVDTAPDYPAGFDIPNVVSVGASGRSDSMSSFSNRGATVDLAAPGEDIVSTVPPNVDASGYASFSGTSMAAPFVAGAASLLMAHSPTASSTQVREALLAGVHRSPAFTGMTASGGRLDLAAALGRPAPTAPPETSKPPVRDTTPPTKFSLLSPRNRSITRRRALRFRWQRSTDASGILYYRVFVDGKLRKTIRDPDGRGGDRSPRTIARLRLRRGKHRWRVRAYDYAGNRRTAKVPRRFGRSSSVLFVGKRRP